MSQCEVRSSRGSCARSCSVNKITSSLILVVLAAAFSLVNVPVALGATDAGSCAAPGAELQGVCSSAVPMQASTMESKDSFSDHAANSTARPKASYSGRLHLPSDSSSINREGDRSCSLYMYDSGYSGRGVYAGVNFEEGSLLEQGVTLLLPESYGSHWQLSNYVYSGGEDLQLVVFGAAMMYSHDNVLRNAEHHWASGDTATNSLSEQRESHSTNTLINYSAMIRIDAGTEIFTSYGEGNAWFVARGIDILEHPTVESDKSRDESERTESEKNESDVSHKDLKRKYVDLKVLEEFGHCLSDVFVGESQYPMAGKGLFAGRQFKAGEIVTISPVVLLPKNEVLETADSSVLINYVITHPDSDVAIMPIGNAAVINHEDKEYANLKMSWFDSKGDLNEKLAKHPLELVAMPNAALDLVYYATKDIEEGEELSLYYGKDWIYLWSNYLAMRIIATEAGDTDLPLFRVPILGPDELYPVTWLDIELQPDYMHFGGPNELQGHEGEASSEEN
jgi:hypothetical protein